MKRLVQATVLMSTAALLAGCSDDDDFDSFFDRQDRGAEETYAAASRNIGINSLGGVVTVDNVATTDLAAEVDIDLDTLRELEGFRLRMSPTDIDFSDDDGDTDIDDDGDFYRVAIDKADQAAIGRIADPDDVNLAFHTYGAWVETDEFGDGNIVSVVTGEVTDPVDVPVAGTASYRGGAIGVFASEITDDIVLTHADVQADVDFGAATDQVAFSTTNTEDAAGNALPNLDAVGTLDIAGNIVAGAIVGGGTFAGDAAGVFAGPSAQELGGLMSLIDAGGTEAYNAGWGTRRTN